MSNAFSAIIATATDAAQVVSQEPVGFIDAIDFRPDEIGATLNSTVNIGVVTVPTKSAWTPGVKTTLVDSTETNVAFTLSQAFEYQFHVTGEQLRALSIGNFNGQRYLDTKLKQAFRQARNDVDAYLATLAKTGASRAVGTAATTPFASNMDISATIRRVLEQNGAPINPGDISIVVDPLAAENVRKLLGTVTAAGGSLAADMQRAGLLPQHNGMQIRTSPQVALHTKGTGTGYTATIALAGVDATLAAGTGTGVAGDIVTFAGDTNNYVLGTGFAAPGSVPKMLNRPGALSVKPAAAMTIGGNYTPNIALHRSSLVAVVRPPDQVDSSYLGGANPGFIQKTVLDPVTGLPYGVYMQPFDGGMIISVRLVYGAAPVNTEHIVTLMG